MTRLSSPEPSPSIRRRFRIISSSVTMSEPGILARERQGDGEVNHDFLREEHLKKNFVLKMANFSPLWAFFDQLVDGN